MNPSVLVVDDDPAIRHMVSEVLRVEGYSVQTAEHGGPALDIMRASQEHLLVTLGLIMPEVDGMAVLEAVVADETLVHRHAIVVVSAAVSILQTGRGAELRQQLDLLLVPKPFTYEQLLETLEDAERRWVERYGDRQDAHTKAVRTLDAYVAGRANIVIKTAAQTQQESPTAALTDEVGQTGHDEVVRPGGQTQVQEDGSLVGQSQVSDHNSVGDGDVDDLLDQAHVLMCRCRYEEALSFTQRAVKLHPRSLKAWCALGSNYGYLGRVADLERAFEQALRLVVTPWDEVEVWYGRGHAENNSSAWQDSVRSFERLAQLEPQWCMPYLLRGMVLTNMGNFLDRHYFEKALLALDAAEMRANLHSDEERMIFDLKAECLLALRREVEARHYQRKAKELRTDKRGASSRAKTLH
jgi:CheY-like chemotaxis protein